MIDGWFVVDDWWLMIGDWWLLDAWWLMIADWLMIDECWPMIDNGELNPAKTHLNWLQMKNSLFVKYMNWHWKSQSTSTCWRKAHNERINIRSFSTGRFGLRSHWRLISSKRHVFEKWWTYEKHVFCHEWCYNLRFWGFEMCNRRGIERSSCLDYSRGLKSIFLNYFVWFYWFSRVWGPKIPKIPYFSV